MFSQLVRKQGKITVSMLSDKKLQDVFAALDDDGSGEVEFAEFTKWMGIEDETKSESDSEPEEDTPDGDKGLKKEVIDAQVEKVVHNLRVSMFRAGSANWPGMFDQYDRAKKGVICLENFRRMMRMDFRVHESVAPDEMLQKIFTMMDEDESGEIAYDEMFAWLIGPTDEDEEIELCKQATLEIELDPLEDSPTPERMKVIRADTALLQKPSELAPNTQIQYGQSITVAGHVGNVRFLGPTSFAPGTWVGIELEKPFGKNDGSVDGTRYFECEEAHGIFVRQEVLSELLRESNSNESLNRNESDGCGAEAAQQEDFTIDPRMVSCTWMESRESPAFKEDMLALVSLTVCETYTKDILEESWLQDPLPGWPPRAASLEPIEVPEASPHDWVSMVMCIRRTVVGQDARDAYDAKRPQRGEVLRSRYAIQSELGKGAYSKAFLAEDKKTKGMVCVKRHNNLSVETLADLLVVAQRVEESDPKERFFPRLLEAFFDMSSFTVESLVEGHHCLAMSKINPGFFGNLSHVQIVACDCLQGLKQLESAGVVHNDLKADNLIWVKGGKDLARQSVKIVDFGSAHLDQQEMSSRNWNLAEGGRGNLGKWPPEMLLKLPISHVADVWGLAVTLCELHCDRFVWCDDRDTPVKVLAQALALSNERLGVPRELLQKSPANVYSFTTPGPRHLPVHCNAQGKLEVLEPTAYGLQQVLGKDWPSTEKRKFGDFLEAALVINPSDRPTAAKLLTMDKCSFLKQ